MSREWNTPHREKWNAPIHNILKAIDNHNQEYFKTQDTWHIEKAQILREYVDELKTWIFIKESEEINKSANPVKGINGSNIEI